MRGRLPKSQAMKALQGTAGKNRGEAAKVFYSATAPATPVVAARAEEIERAVWRVANALHAHEITPEVATSRILRLKLGEAGDLAPGAPSSKRKDYAWGMARMAEIDPTGNSRRAAMRVAKEMARKAVPLGPLDPDEIDKIAQHLRKRRRTQKKNEHARLPVNSGSTV